MYANIVYLPLIYLLTAAPTLLILLGLSLFTVAGVVQFFPQYFFPTDLVLTLASVATIMSGVTFWVYCLVLKKVLQKDKVVDIVTTAQNVGEKFKEAFAPIRDQFKEEQTLIKHAFVERKKIGVSK
ncbi:MAG: hypothetical protein H0V66_12270, partial [Bdellovibrionales bacterium]|nr:hypothetical protein [Bdellovibrionales bacterium]